MHFGKILCMPCAAALIAAIAVDSVFGGALPSAAGGKPRREDYVACWGVDLKDHGRSFGSDGNLEFSQIATTCDCNMAYPGDTLTVTAQLRNLTADPMTLKGRWIFLRHGFRTGKDVFDLSLVKYGEEAFGDVDVEIPAKGVVRTEVTPPLPGEFGAGVVLFERDDGHRFLLAGVARIVEPALAPGQLYYQVCMDLMDLPDAAKAIARLHTAPNRMGLAFWTRDDCRTPEECEARYQKAADDLRAIQAAGYPVCVEWGAGADRGPSHPLGRTRPHLSDDNIMLETKSDYAWLPKYDAEFKERVKWLVKEFGYPRGPVNSLMLWNEPWNGMSISGWGADDLRYREIYTAMCEAADEAMAESKAEGREVHVLLGGCDSSANTFDKFYCDVGPGEEGNSPFLKWQDFVSLHYQGLFPSNPRFLRDRRHPVNGRTMFWDTESWVANSEDRVPGVIAGMLAAGHDRLVGIQAHAVVASTYNVVEISPDDGKAERKRVFNAWPVAPALAAFQHLVGNRPFAGLAWEGLPWVYEFADKGDADDVTFVVTGDISPVFNDTGKTGAVPFRTCRPADGERLSGAMTLPVSDAYALYDGNGNAVAPVDGKVVVPLDDLGYYLRASGAKGSGETLRSAIANARIDGYSPVAPALRDAVADISDGAAFEAILKNVLNRPLKGTLSIACEGLELAYDSNVELAPHATATIGVKVVSGQSDAGNCYPVSLRFDTGDDGVATLDETLHCNVIASRTVTVDGDLSDWEGALAQPILSSSVGATQMERAWMPMVHYDGGDEKDLAVGFVSADDDYFYFAARIADDTPDEGMMRFETRDEDADFYPDQVFDYDRRATFSAKIAQSKFKYAGADAPSPVWIPLTDGIAFTLDAPEEGMRIAVRAVDDGNPPARSIAATVIDAREKDKSAPPVTYYFGFGEADQWLRFNVHGRVRVQLAGRNWMKFQIAAIALDPIEEGLEKGAVDAETGAAFAGKYGTLGLFTPETGSNGEHGFTLLDEVTGNTLTWPEGVRHYSYWRRPQLPQGQGHDSVQLAFNVLPDEEKRWYPAAPGTFKGYAGYWDTDYEFALNPVAEAFGGGVEIWRNRAPYLPDKHYYPHSPKHPREGAVEVGPEKGKAHLVMLREGDMRIVEAAIPWSEIPEVKTARDEGRPFKFSYRVNDNASGSLCMELAFKRSVSKRNEAFKPNWCEHWANELLFGWGKR